MVSVDTGTRIYIERFYTASVCVVHINYTTLLLLRFLLELPFRSVFNQILTLSNEKFYLGENNIDHVISVKKI